MLSAGPSALAIFVDYDGTITDVDTFDLLVRSVAGDAAWDEIEDDIAAGTCTLRRALERQAALIHLDPDDAFSLVESKTIVDPTFVSFVDAAKRHGAQISIVSSGMRQMIEPRLKRSGIDVPIFANEVIFDPHGWRLKFLDDSPNGHDKSVRVLEARAAGFRTVYIGDGISDFAAASEADERFAKAGRALERFCRERNLACTSFTTFDEVNRAMFGVKTPS